MKRALILVIIVAVSGAAQAKVDLVTLPSRDTVQLTIYNSADLTLVRESRALTLKEGKNSLQFSWANTLIDPTSLEMLPKANADRIDIADLTYPPRVKNLGLWNIESSVSGRVPVEITFLTSGLSWRAFYMGTLSQDEKTMQLKGYVRVTNNSGEDYENAQTRLIVGKVHILDQIAELARRQYPYERPGMPERYAYDAQARDKRKVPILGDMAVTAGTFIQAVKLERKEIVKEGLSEYFLYTIEGTETIPTGWSKRLLSFDKSDVPVVNLYKHEQERYGNSVVRFLSFKNDEEHKLGETPIPGGILKVYRAVDDKQHVGYVGQSAFKYIPVDEDVELNLGAVADVVVEPKLMDYKTDNYRFDRRGNISGWDEIRKFTIEAKNTRNIPVKVDIKRNFNTPYWDLKKHGDFGDFEKVDVDTVKFTLKLRPQTKKQFSYTLTTYHGVRREDWTHGITKPVKSPLKHLQKFGSLQKHIVGLWSFDERGGKTAYDSLGNSHGSVLGAKWATGRAGGVLSFDGMDDHVTIGKNDDVFPNTILTWSVWIKPSSYTPNGVILWDDDFQSGGDRGIELRSDGKIGAGDWFTNTISSSAISLGEWHYIVFTSGDDEMKLYIDGKLNATGSGLLPDHKGRSFISIGSGHSGARGYFHGLSDEVVIYDKALSAEQILQLYQSDLKGL